jgi:hypothetical protein
LYAVTYGGGFSTGENYDNQSVELGRQFEKVYRVLVQPRLKGGLLIAYSYCNAYVAIPTI